MEMAEIVLLVIVADFTICQEEHPTIVLTIEYKPLPRSTLKISSNSNVQSKGLVSPD
jgi:hypothetical protein